MEPSETQPGLNTEIKVAPKNLKTLCILSMIMCGIMIILSLYSLKVTYMPSENDTDKLQQQVDIIQKNNPDGYDLALSIIDSQGIQYGASLFVEIVALIAVMMMLRLKKTGFYIYLFAELIPYLVTITLVGVKGLPGIGAAMGAPMDSISWAIFALAVIIDFVFIFLYSKQLKYMS